MAPAHSPAHVISAYVLPSSSSSSAALDLRSLRASSRHAFVELLSSRPAHAVVSSSNQPSNQHSVVIALAHPPSHGHSQSSSSFSLEITVPIALALLCGQRVVATTWLDDAKEHQTPPKKYDVKILAPDGTTASVTAATGGQACRNVLHNAVCALAHFTETSARWSKEQHEDDAGLPALLRVLGAHSVARTVGDALEATADKRVVIICQDESQVESVRGAVAALDEDRKFHVVTTSDILQCVATESPTIPLLEDGDDATDIPSTPVPKALPQHTTPRLPSRDVEKKRGKEVEQLATVGLGPNPKRFKKQYVRALDPERRLPLVSFDYGDE